MSTCPDPECGAEVIKAQDVAGGTILLNPNTYQAGKFAAYEDEHGIWHARYITPAHPPKEYESRHSAHKCAKLAPVRQAQATSAATARNHRGNYAARRRDPLRGAVPGGQIPPPGGAR